MTPRELAADICRKLQASGFKAYLVGGCVRDLLLGREPEDYDVATDAHPARVQELFPSSVRPAPAASSSLARQIWRI